MSKSRDIGDSAATINFIDNLTSDAQTQLNTLTTNVATNATAISNINVTSGSQTKTYGAGETSTITLSGNVLSPIIGVTKEVAQSGVSNNDWDVNSSSENYTRYNSAAAVTLDFDNYAIGSATATSIFSLSSQENQPQGITFKSDGTKMYVVGLQHSEVFQYSLSSAFDVTTASYDSVNKNVYPQDSAIRDLEFNTDGTKMFVVGDTNNSIYEYALTSAYDVSSASYTRQRTVGSQDTAPMGLAFNSDGTKMFVAGSSDDRLYEYSVTSAFDMSTASYANQSYQFSSQCTNPGSVRFSADGKKFFITDASNGKVHEYSLSTGFDLSSTVAFVQSLDVSSQEGEVRGLAFNSEGTKLFIVGESGDEVNEYALPREKFILGSGSFASADVGKTIEANSGVFILTSTAGAFSQTTAPTSYAQVASGSWQMYGVVFNTTDGDLELSGLITDTYDISTASFSQNFSISAQETNPQSLAFNNDGTKMFVIGFAEDKVFEYTLSTGFNVSTASYSKSFSVSSQETLPAGIDFNSDGTKMYIVGVAGQDVNEYNLSTGFDVSTASYLQNFSLSSQETSPRGIKFNTNGTKMFIVGVDGDEVNEYALSTGFNISTASYTRNFSVSGQDTDPEDIAFNTDGTKMYIVGGSGDDVNEYNLTTGFDLSTASYLQNFSVASQEATPSGLAFSPDGTKMFIVGGTGDDVNEYTVGTTAIPSGYHAAHTTTSTDSTYWTDINSMTADEAAGDGAIYYCVSTDDRTTWKVAKGTDGERSIVRNNSGTWQYNSNATYGSTTWANATTNAELAAIQEAMTGAVTTTGYVLSGASYDSVNFSFTGQTSTPRGLVFSADGTKMYVVAEPNAYQYTLTTAYDLTSASYASKSFAFNTQSTSVLAIAFNSDGTKMYGISYSDKTVYQYALSTAYDISTASYDSKSFSVNAQETDPYNLTFNSNGTKMFVIGTSGDDVNEYALSTADDVSTASFTTNFSVASQETTPYGLAFSSDGTSMFVCGGDSDSVHKYTLSTGFDVSNASFTESFSVAGQETTPNGIAFNSDGTKMFVSGTSSDKVHQYSTGTSSYPNQMNKTQLDAIPDANHFTLANDLDLAIIFNLSSGSTIPSSDGVAINYDANVLNQGAILGTDYTYDAPAQNKVRITSTNAANLKVRIV
jgi:sugar lactone lactonase YvrE